MISDNITLVKEKISLAAQKSGRRIEDIKIIAVSKNVNLKDILLAIRSGIKNLGENKAQELKEKIEEIELSADKEEYSKAIWHFIGHLQSNKAKIAVRYATYIHSVDSLKLVEEINKKSEQLNKKINILLEYKTSDEPTKYGIESFDDLVKIAEKCSECDYINLVGLMTMAPLTEDKNKIRKSFVALREAMDKLNARGFKLTELSMGMSSDYEIAVEEGSTMVRIGTAIFGERDYSKSWREQ